MIILGSLFKVNSYEWLASTFELYFFLERYFLESVGYEDSIESLDVLMRVDVAETFYTLGSSTCSMPLL
jgi:hypothetical protein